jgi:DNA modification methylase
MTKLERYRGFLKRKAVVTPDRGFAIDLDEINPILKPHQKVLAQWGVAGGCRALFAKFGLGKSMMQLEILRLILKRTGGRGLITAPLGVRVEFMRDAAKLGIEIKFIRRIEEAAETGIYLTNFETVRDGKLDPGEFVVCSLDEASVLRGFGGSKTFREFMRLYERVQYKFVATAIPDPNDHIELLAYAAFLGIMDVGQAKTRFFKRDATKADTLTIHPHKEREFWLWVSSWAIFLQKPSDLGFSDEGYDLPPMEVRYHEVAVDHTNSPVETNGQGTIFRGSVSGVVEASREKRDTLGVRNAKVLEVIFRGREETSVSERLLREKQGEVDFCTERPEQSQLPEKQRGDSYPLRTVEREQSGACSGVGSERLRTQPRQEESTISRVVYGEQGSGAGADQEAQTTGLRSDTPVLSEDAHKPTQLLRDLQISKRNERREGKFPRGSRSCDREGSRTAVSRVQLRSRNVSGQPENIAGGDCISEQIVVWCDLNAEQRELERLFGNSGITFSSLDGSMDIEDREERIEQWRNRETTVFLSKPVMYGSGVNLQQCHRVIFSGIGFKFSEFIQAIHRCHRFLQEHPVIIDVIYAESEREVLRNLQTKWAQYEETVQKMSEIIREYGLDHAEKMQELIRSMGVERIEVSGENYRCINNDAVEEALNLPAGSIDMVLTSIPFSTQYEYTPSYNDFGHTDDNEHFFEQMDFLTPELLRVLQPGRIAAIHVKDRIVPGGMTGLGFQTTYPFHMKVTEHFIRHGFAYMGMKTIVTDVVRENNQTYRLGWTEQCKDGTKMGVGMPEYLLLFRKPPTENSNSYADNPVVKSKAKYSRARWQTDAHGFARSSGNRLLTPDELDNLDHQAIFKLFRDYNLTHIYDYEHHVKIGEALEAKRILPVTFMLLQPPSWHPDVWSDVTRMLTLNGAQHAKGKELHICPMQFDIADRAIEQFTMPGETVFDPFGGLMTTAYRALKLGRKAIATELNHRYFLDGCGYAKAMEDKMAMPTLFDILEESEDMAVVA